MEAKVVDEETRYDRQVRLWGASTQRRLKLTHVYFDGIAGASSEMAKNLALAGVRSIVVNDNHTITESDYHNNFLVQSVRNEAKINNEKLRGSAAATALRSLNPFVEIKCNLEYENVHTEMRSSNNNNDDDILVCVVQVETIQEMQVAISRFTTAEILMLSYTTDNTTVATFILYAHHDAVSKEKQEEEEEHRYLVQDIVKNKDSNNIHCSIDANSFNKQLQSLLYDVNTTQRLPRQMQRALLQLHLNEIMYTANQESNSFCGDDLKRRARTKSTSSIMASALNIVEVLKLYALTAEDIASSVSENMHFYDCRSKIKRSHELQTDAITATMCGAALAQFLILQISNLKIKDGHQDDHSESKNDCRTDALNKIEKNSNQWLLCDGAAPAVMIDS